MPHCKCIIVPEPHLLFATLCRFRTVQQRRSVFFFRSVSLLNSPPTQKTTDHNEGPRATTPLHIEMVVMVCDAKKNNRLAPTSLQAEEEPAPKTKQAPRGPQRGQARHLHEPGLRPQTHEKPQERALFFSLPHFFSVILVALAWDFVSPWEMAPSTTSAPGDSEKKNQRRVLLGWWLVGGKEGARCRSSWMWRMLA